MELYEVMRVTGTVRAFRPDPVPDEILYRVLDHARFAPNGGNRQGWRVIVVKDPVLRRTVHSLYQQQFNAYVEKVASGSTPTPPERILRQGEQLAHHLGEVPVHLLVLVDLRTLAVLDAGLPRQSIVGGGSIYPFVQNILLALRNEGLAGAITTLVVPSEAKLKQLFGIPEHYGVAAMVLAGWPATRLPTRLKRKPVDEFASVDKFSGSMLSASARPSEMR